MKQEELDKILQSHKLWLEGKEDGVGANLRGANLRYANLQDANLQDANLQRTDLRDANLQGANLQGADLRSVNLQGANLQGADLRSVNLQRANLRYAVLWSANLQGAHLQGADLWCAFLRNADLQGADLHCANLQGADLRSVNLLNANLQGANLQDANLQDANLPEYDFLPKGEIIVWKKLKNQVLCKLLIEKEVRRTCSLIGRKCRAEKAKVLGFFDLQGKELDIKESRGIYSTFIYRKDEYVLPDFYNDDIRIECSNGIHFFETFEEAKNW